MPKQENLHAWLGTMRITSLLRVRGRGQGEGRRQGGRAGRRVHFGALRLGWALPCYPPKQATPLLLHYQPAPPTHAVCTSPHRGHGGPREMGLEVCGSCQGWGLPLLRGDPLSPQPTQEPLPRKDEVRRRQGLLPAPGASPGSQDPQTPEPPVGCFSGRTSPQSSQLQPDISDGETEASCSALEAALGTNPPAPPSLPRAAAGAAPGASPGEEKEAALWAGGASGMAPASSLPSP